MSSAKFSASTESLSIYIPTSTPVPTSEIRQHRTYTIYIFAMKSLSLKGLVTLIIIIVVNGTYHTFPAVKPLAL